MMGKEASSSRTWGGREEAEETEGELQRGSREDRGLENVPSLATNDEKWRRRSDLLCRRRRKGIESSRRANRGLGEGDGRKLEVSLSLPFDDEMSRYEHSLIHPLQESESDRRSVSLVEYCMVEERKIKRRKEGETNKIS